MSCTDLLPRDFQTEQKPGSPKPPAKRAANKGFIKQTTIIFDWDDTLLASTVLCNAGITLQSPCISKDLKQQLTLLENQVIRLISRATETAARVFIITNAEVGWVELSAQKFMPRVVPYLERATVFSARSTYQHCFPNNPNQWKATAFSERICSQFPKMAEMNIVSFGDSECERSALLNVGRFCANSRTKSIKFVERPTVEQLRRQLEMICNNFAFIVQHDGNLDLMLTISSTGSTPLPPPCAETVPLPNVLPVQLPAVPVAGLGNGLGGR